MNGGCGNNDAGSTGGDSTASSTSTSSNSAPVGTIVEDDQQLYDWGIENRMDQYYQVKASEERVHFLHPKTMLPA